MLILIRNSIGILIEIINYLLLARVILSWIPIGTDNVIIRFIYQVTEPILAPIRKIVDRSAVGSNMMIDFSPLIAFLILSLIRTFI